MKIENLLLVPMSLPFNDIDELIEKRKHEVDKGEYGCGYNQALEDLSGDIKNYLIEYTGGIIKELNKFIRVGQAEPIGNQEKYKEMKKIKIEGVVKLIAQDGDEIEYPFESETIDGAIAELGKIGRHIEKKIAEAENVFED